LTPTTPNFYTARNVRQWANLHKAPT
jgi:hypothetical protein